MANEDERMLAWLANKTMEQANAYAASGRSLAQLPTEEVEHLWIKAMKEWSLAPFKRPRPQMVDTAESELYLRGLSVPLSKVLKEWDIIKAASAKATEKLRSDPDELEAMGQEIMDEMNAFDEKAKANKN